jgi:hypothetical protein
MSIQSSRERANRLRTVPLQAVLHAAGAQPDPHQKAKWHTSRGVLSVTGAKFINWNQGFGGGGAIDLTMHLNHQGFQDAIDWLARHFPLPEPAPPIRAPSSRPLTLPARVTRTLPALQRYLCGKRRLPPALLRTLIEAGDLYADPRANAVFLLRDEQKTIVGAELRGTGPRLWRGMAPGSSKDRGYFAIGPEHPDALMLCESAIDAISSLALHPRRLCISTSGARPDPGWLPALLARNRLVYCAFDADSTGEHMAQRMIARHPAVQRLRPPLHDWNDTLYARG